MDESADELSEASLMIRLRRVLPGFWTAVIILAFGLNTVNLAVNRPEQLHGWRVFGLVVLLFCLIRAYQWLGRGRIYHDDAVSERAAMLLVGVQLLTVFLLVKGYDPSFALFGLPVLYQIIGGLSRRNWLVPLLGLGLVFAATVLPAEGVAPINAGSVVGGIILVVSNLGIALFIRSLGKQHDQLQVTVERLRQAYGALTIDATHAEELAVLRERTRLARTMHDEIGHALVVINIKLEAAQLLYAHDPAKGDAELEATRALIRKTMTDLRQALANMRAPVAEYDDLPDALERLAQETQSRTGITLTCSISDLTSMPTTDARRALWYVTREALTNVEQHADATCATISFERLADDWRLCIMDNGAGINFADLDRPGHYGVLGMRERMHGIGGTLAIRPGISRGTIVEACVPAGVGES